MKPNIGAGAGGLSVKQSLRAISAAAEASEGACEPFVVLWDGR